MNKMIAMSVAMIISGTALAEPVVISTGVPGGSYVGVYGANLSKLLAAKKIENKLVNSAGSMENLKRLESNEAQIAPATLDAYALYLKKGGTPLNILATLKSECGYLVVNKNGKVKNEDDLQTVKGVTIAVGPTGSGSETMWTYMTMLEPKYKNAKVDYQGGTLATNRLAAQTNSTADGIDAILYVTTRDNLTHKMTQAVNNNPNLKFVDIDDNDLNDKLPDGKAVYTFENNKVKDSWSGSSVATICTSGALFYNNKADQNVIETISDYVALSPNGIVGN
jgi:TRAP-type uncharacterized transport system substrate-binding protein